MNFTENVNEILKQEAELVFESFTMEEAYALGTLLYTKAKEHNLPVAIDITRSGQQLYHAALPGAVPDNDRWIERKIRLVNRFYHSSFYIYNLLESLNTTLEDQYFISSNDYAARGGSFPIFIKGCGMVGTVTVSGLPQEEDHKFVVTVIKEFLENGKNVKA